MAEPVRILWIDPDIISVVRYAKSLERRGWTVDFAQSFGHALHWMAHASYDVAIVDLMLPDATGSDAWYEIQQAHPQMRGIITTRSTSLHAYVNPLGPGAVAYLLKPLDIDSVAARIDQALGRESAITSPIPQAGLPAELSDEWLGRFRQPDGWDLENIFKIIQTRFDYWLTQLQSYWQRIQPFQSFRGSVRLSASPVLVAFVVAIVLCLSGVSTMAVAAQGALPGERLYPVKMMVETAQLAISPDAASRAQLRLFRASRRLNEIRGLIAQGQSDQVPSTTAAFEQEVEQAAAELDRAAVESPARAAALAPQLAVALSQDIRVLIAVRETAPLAVRSDLDRSLHFAETSMAVVQLQATPPGQHAPPPAIRTGTATLTLTDTATPTATFEPTQTWTLEATETAELTDTPQPTALTQLTATLEPTETPEPERNTREATETNRTTATPAPTDTPHPRNTPEPTKTKPHPPPSPPPPTPKPSHTPKPTKTPKSPHAPNMVQGAPTPSGGASANLANEQAVSPDRGRPVAPFTLSDEFQPVLGFVIAEIERGVDYLKMLLSSP